MKKQIIFHIGAHKTGTSFLQDVMLQNHLRLLEQSVVYAGKCTLMKRSPGDVLDPAFDQKCEAFLSSDMERLIVSDEDLCHDNGNVLRKLLNSLSDEADIKVVYYVREIISYFLSFYKFTSYWRCNGSEIPTFSNLMEYAAHSSIYVRGHKLISDISLLLGKENTLVRRYSKESFGAGGLEKDFFDLLDIESSKFTIPVQRVNSSPSLRQAEQLFWMLRYTQNPKIRIQARDAIMGYDGEKKEEKRITIDEVEFIHKKFRPVEEAIERDFLDSNQYRASFDNHFEYWKERAGSDQGSRYLNSHEVEEVCTLVDIFRRSSS